MAFFVFTSCYFLHTQQMSQTKHGNFKNPMANLNTNLDFCHVGGPVWPGKFILCMFGKSFVLFLQGYPVVFFFPVFFDFWAFQRNIGHIL